MRIVIHEADSKVVAAGCRYLLADVEKMTHLVSKIQLSNLEDRVSRLRAFVDKSVNLP